ncbi:MAG: BtrH N-terminal domain-containing protein [Deltaproteobacteria bacterium]|nr:MAG: BtrH N-terminal domain-containing protein [Deltaproteobacteria bacterium]
MVVRVEGYEHRTGAHCASTALRNILRFHRIELSEAMIFGLSSGLGFYYLRSPDWSPARMFHGRTATLEEDLGRNTGLPFADRPEPDDDRAWELVRRRVDAGEPVMVSTDTYYLGYHHTTSHFPGHRAVVVGYDPVAATVFLADRRFEEYQTCSFDELRRARNAPDYALRCQNRYGDFYGEVTLGRPLAEAIRTALRRNCTMHLTHPTEPVVGIGGMRALAADFGSWRRLEDWSWAARFGYQVIVKRGSGGSFFRSLYAEFLQEVSALVPAVGDAGLPLQMSEIAAGWRDLAAVLEEQSEREQCSAALFGRAGDLTTELADAEAGFFDALLKLVEEDAGWDCGGASAGV